MTFPRDPHRDDTLHRPQIDLNTELLRGRAEIAKFIRVSGQTLDYFLDIGLFPIFRGGPKRGFIFTTKSLIIQGIEAAAKTKVKSGRQYYNGAKPHTSTEK